MARPNLGSKRVCPSSSCARKFYDLGRDPATCPECGARHPQTSFRKPRRARPPAPRAAPEKPAAKDKSRENIDLEDEDDDDLDDDLGNVVSAGAKNDGEDDT